MVVVFGMDHHKRTDVTSQKRFLSTRKNQYMFFVLRQWKFFLYWFPFTLITSI